MENAEYAYKDPKEVRKLIGRHKITGETSGMCIEYAQANLVVLPEKYAYDFLLFAMRNPTACPLLEVTDTGNRKLETIAKGADIATEIPKYRVYREGKLERECNDVADIWCDDFVSFLIGCSFSFEGEMLRCDLPVRQIEMGCNVPMYNTNIPCREAGIFHGNMVVSMRPMPVDKVIKAVQVTAEMPRVHGAPIHIGDPGAIGIRDLDHPDYGDPVKVREGEVPMFWPCGVTPQAAVMASRPDLCITHSPGHMLITDVKNVNLKYQEVWQK